METQERRNEVKTRDTLDKYCQKPRYSKEPATYLLCTGEGMNNQKDVMNGTITHDQPLLKCGQKKQIIEMKRTSPEKTEVVPTTGKSREHEKTGSSMRNYRLYKVVANREVDR